MSSRGNATRRLTDMVFDDISDAFETRYPFTGGAWKVVSITPTDEGVVYVLDVNDEAHFEDDGVEPTYKCQTHDLIVYAWYRRGEKHTTEPSDVLTDKSWRIGYYATVFIPDTPEEPAATEPSAQSLLADWAQRREQDERQPKHWYCVTQDPRFPDEAYEDSCYTEHRAQVYEDEPFDAAKWHFAHDLGALWHGADDDPVYENETLHYGDVFECLGPAGQWSHRFVQKRPEPTSE